MNLNIIELFPAPIIYEGIPESPTRMHFKSILQLCIFFIIINLLFSNAILFFLFNVEFRKRYILFFRMLKEKSEIAKKSAKLKQQQNPYQTVKLVGQGTFGKVYLVTHKKTSKKFAMKEAHQDKRYKNRQLSIISLMKNSNIVQLHDYFFKINNSQCYLYLVMDFFPHSLYSFIKEQRKINTPFNAKARKLLLFQLMKGLYYLSINNVCHRDLKPPNILINNDTNELRICDFGSAKIIQIKENNVPYICSRYYRAPELLLGSTTYGCEIDMWSAGCIMVQFLSLEPIFPGDSSLEQLIEIIKILGTPPLELIQISIKNQGQVLNLPNIKPASWERILRKYKAEPQYLDLLSKILTYDTTNRIKPQQALKHPYFSDILQYEKQLSKLPNLLNFEELYNGYNRKFIKQLSKIYEIKEQEEEIDDICMDKQSQSYGTTCQGSPNMVEYAEL